MKKSSKILISVFIIISLLPSLGILAFGQSKAAANEILSPKPKLFESDGSINAGYLNDCSDRFADTFALRQQFVSLWALINSSVFKTSVEPQVTVGKDGWLFYSSTLDDYKGISLSDRDIFKAARNLYLIQEYAQSMGADFAFTVAPNKNSLYGEYMPSHVQRGTKSNAQTLRLMLNEQGVNYVDLFSVLSGDEIVYFATDSHWNSRGAALAADALLSSLGRTSVYGSLQPNDYRPHKGDLYEMLYPAGQRTEADPVLTEDFSYICENDPNGGNAISINTSSEGEGSLVCWRDSFGISLYPYLAESFGEALFSRASAYDMSLLGDGCDAVIIELVERNIPQLIEKAPVFPAPLRTLETELIAAEQCSGSISTGKSENLICLNAELPEEWLDFESSVYVKCGAEYYEACLLDAGEDMLGISAWLDPALEIEGLVCLKDDNFIFHPIKIQ